MFDVISANLLRSAPSLPELNSDEIPGLLTRHYTELMSARLRGGDIEEREYTWSLDRIADAYEIVASVETVPSLRRAAAFVAGTAQQIIARRRIVSADSNPSALLERDSVDPSIAAALLFLAAEQYADANEAALSISQRAGPYEVRILSDHVKDLARGRLDSILQRAERWRRDDSPRGTLQNRAFRALASTLIEGIELLAAHLMSAPLPGPTPRRFDSAQSAFRQVIALATQEHGQFESLLIGGLITSYAGPAHLASLLLSATDGIAEASLTRLPPPRDANPSFWKEWLRLRAKEMPFVWPNHREAISLEFYESGRSAVLVLPTGAGKTTVSALKIAGTLARGKKVIFLAPTHALVEQMTEDLQAIFPADKFGLGVSSDFDSLLLDDAQLEDVEVMTPERCLAMLSFANSDFANVGLLVFDECHLLSSQSGKIGRALDGMLCLLAFSSAAPEADMLFLSAMLKNGQQFAEWIENLTRRPCASVELLWKPSRQARGVVVYNKDGLDAVLRQAREEQRRADQKSGKVAKTLRASARRLLVATPNVVWGLQHNWLASPLACTFTAISEHEIQLGGGFRDGTIWMSPNANSTAAEIAVSATKNRLKTIIFVNTKADAIRTAHELATKLDQVVALTESEGVLWDALTLELGDARHSVFGTDRFCAVPHNASMLRLERALAERVFRRADGAQVIVATPTLAQGLNLPAHLAIIAGDKRAGEAQGEREDLEAHELLNAAARAGRAGHLANGVVILIPEPIIKFTPGAALTPELKGKLSSVLPEDDRCVTIGDPLEVVLDRVGEGRYEDREVRYTINRLALLGESNVEVSSQDNLMARSLGSFLARREAGQVSYLRKVEELWVAVKEAIKDGPDDVVLMLASQSGLSLDLLERLRVRIVAGVGSLPTSIVGWVEWSFQWLGEDAASRDALLHDVRTSGLKAVGRPTASALDKAVLEGMLDGVKAWIEGAPLNEIERALGGDPDSQLETSRMCPRARELVATFIPRGLSFVMGVVSRMAEELNVFALQENLSKRTVQCLSSAVRKGFDSLGKLEHANSHKELIGRVQAHRDFERNARLKDFDDVDDDS